MPEHCPVCRTELLPGCPVCLTCGAILAPGHRSFAGRPFVVLAMRWLVLTQWLSLIALMPFALLPSFPGSALVVVASITLGGLAMTCSFFVRSAAGIWLAVVNGAAGLTAGLLSDDWSGWGGSGVSPAAMGLVLLAALGTCPFVYRLWRHPLPVVQPWRCRHCGYALHGLPQPRCPECGTSFEPFTLHRGVPRTGGGHDPSQSLPPMKEEPQRKMI